MKKKLSFLSILFLLSIFGFSQNVELIDGIAYIDGNKYIKLEKINRKKFVVRNIDSDEKILEIKLFKAYNHRDKRTHKLPSVFFNRINQSMEFENDIKNELDLVEFLYKNEIVFLDGKPNEKKVYDYLEYIENWRKEQQIKQEKN